MHPQEGKHIHMHTKTSTDIPRQTSTIKMIYTNTGPGCKGDFLPLHLGDQADMCALMNT